MFKIGQKIDKANYTQAAIWANANGAHIEKKDDGYIIVANEQIKPTVEEQVAALEAQTGLTRPIREMVLAENSGVSAYVKEKAQSIEDLAQTLRTAEGAEQ